MKLPDDLLPSDILLYGTPDIVDGVIQTYTGSDVAHIEIYHGNGLSLASRNGIGVNAYPYRSDGLRYVRRLVCPFDRHKADAWFYAKAKGLPYGFAGLLTFVNVDIPCTGLICSVFANLYLQNGDALLFADDYPVRKIDPRDFKLTREAITVWALGLSASTVPVFNQEQVPDGGESHSV